MTSYLLNFTKGLVPVPSRMPDLARDLVRRGLYGIPASAMLRHKIRPGDLVIVAVGSPHRVFVADARIETGYHPFDDEERARRPEWMNLDHGIGLRDVHTWSAPVPIMAVWPKTAAGATKNKKALFFGTLITLKPGDDMVILAGWRDTLRPAVRDPDHRFTVWPFDGQLQALLSTSDAVLVETYPADAYLQLGLSIGRPGASKRRQQDRRADANRLLDWCAEHAVVPDQSLTEQIIDGFGSSSAGEDPFDAVIGLFSMIDTVHRAAEPELPGDPAIRFVEGWMFGQHASCP